jgi:hypothetical protein
MCASIKSSVKKGVTRDITQLYRRKPRQGHAISLRRGGWHVLTQSIVFNGEIKTVGKGGRTRAGDSGPILSP